jgi:hypothetical protein
MKSGDEGRRQRRVISSSARLVTGTLPANDATWDADARRYAPSAFVASHDAPLIGRNAPQRGRSAAESADERARCDEALSVEFQLYGSREAALSEGAGRAFRVSTRPALSPATTRRLSTNAPQRRRIEIIASTAFADRAGWYIVYG